MTLLATQLAPLCTGIAVRHWKPSVAARLHRPATVLSKILNLAVVVLILAAQYRTLSEITLRALAGMIALLIASLAAGCLLTAREPAVRRAMTLTASLRNVCVGLMIATASFPGTAAVTAVIIYGLIEVVGSLLLAVVGTSTPRERSTASDGGPGV